MRAAWECVPGKTHYYDAYSGWCLRGCGNREDGRVINRGGDQIIPGPNYSLDELEVFRIRLESKPK